MDEIEDKNKYSYVFKKTFDLVFEKKYVLMKALFIPFIILTLIEYFSIQIAVYFSVYLLVILYVFITVIMSVLVHRIFLLDKVNSPKLLKISFYFFLKALGLGILTAIFIGLSFFLITLSERLFYDSLDMQGIMIYSFAIKGIVILFILGLFSRFSLIFPSIAIDKSMGFADAFVLSSNYKLFVFLNIIVIPVVLGMIIGGVYGIVIGFLMGIISPKLSILSSLVNIFVTIFSIGFLSVTYEYIMNKKEDNYISEEEVVLA